jgi:peptidoglycan hydrolase-like protein with peptidoglycan-binding domain
MADEPELSRGASGEWVQYLQQLLERWGHSPGSIDSEFAASTEDAVRSFQGAAGLTADGVVNAATWAALVGDAGAAGSSSSGGDVPQEFVDAGAPANLSEWTEEQRNGYFKGEENEDVGGDPAEELAIADIGGGEGEGQLA